MIPNNVKRADVTGTFGDTDDFEMQVDTAAMAHIMGLLTNLYSDEEMACIREYSTNALDAQFDAGVTTPIEVTTPTRLAPFLRIKDRGVGMNKETIRDVYSQYGKSTKREQVETNGSMGIGGKAALAYATQFTVVGVKDGVKTTVSVSMREDGTGVMQVIDESKTDESNGVEVIIPVKAYNEFQDKAEYFFQFWKKGTVLLNGADPTKDFEKMTDRIYLHDGDEDIIVMGNVPYPIEGGHGISASTKKVVAFVTMNGDDEVVFTPSREGLIYNGITKNSLMGIREEYTSTLKVHIKSMIENADSHYAAWKMRNTMIKEYGVKMVEGVQYKGLDFPNNLLNMSTGVYFRSTHWHPGRARNSVNGGMQTGMDTLDQAAMVIVGYAGTGVSSANKARIRQYAREKGITILAGHYGSNIVLTSETTLPGAPWTDKFPVHKWKDILAATKSEKVASSGGGFSYEGRYDVYNTSTGGFEVDDVPAGAKVLYYSPADASHKSNFLDRILEIDPDVVIIEATANRHAKIARLYDAKPLNPREWYALIGNGQFEALTDDEIESLRIQHIYEDYYYTNSRLSGLSHHNAFKAVDKIDDLEYAGVIRKYHSKVTKETSYMSYSPKYKALVSAWDAEKNTVTSFTERYPLMDWRGNSTATLDYINIMFANKKGN